jgi:hypothetical protein
VSPEQARTLFLEHCKPGGAATLQRYGTQAAIDAIGALTGFIEAEARRYAALYPEASDGRNTFVIFADMVSGLTAQQVSGRCEHCDDTGDVHRADGEWLGSCDCQGRS